MNNGVTQATETMTWDKESRMLTNSLANSSYVYNGFDTRVSKTVSSTTTTFKRAGADPVSPVLSDVAGSTTTNHLPGISSRTGSTSTFSHSGIKNGILQTNSSQSNTATKRYDAFGNELSSTGTWQTRFDYGGGFGYQRDDESGYKLLGHRYYDPEIGRFLTRDPMKDGRNWYTYCENNPITFADPNGAQSLSVQGDTTGVPAADFAYWWGLPVLGPKDTELFTPNLKTFKAKLIEAEGVFYFNGHGKSDGGLDLGSDTFSQRDLEDVIRERKRRGKKKLEVADVRCCFSSSKAEYVNRWLQIANVMKGYPGLTGNKGPFHGDGWYPKINPLQVYDKPITVDPGGRHPKKKPKKVEKGRG